MKVVTEHTEQPSSSSPAPPRTAQRFAITRAREFSIIAAAILIFGALALTTPGFLTQTNLLNVARQISFLAIVGIGMTFVFVAGELDLSVGSLYGCLAAVMAAMTIVHGLSPWLAIILVVVLGCVAGALNGLVVTRLGIPSFIVTLAGLSIYRGLTLVISDGNPISGLDAPTFKMVTSGYIFGQIPAQIIWLTILALGGHFFLSRTRFGYNIYATGGNAEAAKRAGIPVRRIKTIAFIITGGLVGLISGLLVGWLRGTSPLVGSNFELSVIAAVIIGGTNLFGGAGTVYGTITGAAIMGMISNGLVLLGISAYVEPIVTGAIILFAVMMDVLIRKAHG